VYEKVFKRIIDLLIGLLAFPFFLVCYVIIGAAIKLDDGGPIFFAGERLGKNLKKYKMYKFRSMIVNAPDVRNKDGSTFNSSGDSRLTRVGRIIRKLSIDEVPQILNVITGTMSVIGPRPSPIGNAHIYSQEYKKKFNVRPGITGYTQAYYRNGASLDEKQKWDLYYVENISFLMDIKVFFKTIATVFKREGLYTNQTSGKEANM